MSGQKLIELGERHLIERDAAIKSINSFLPRQSNPVTKNYWERYDYNILVLDDYFYSHYEYRVKMFSLDETERFCRPNKIDGSLLSLIYDNAAYKLCFGVVPLTKSQRVMEVIRELDLRVRINGNVLEEFERGFDLYQP